MSEQEHQAQLEQEQIAAAGGGLFGDDDDDVEDNNGQMIHNQEQLEQYQADLGLDDDVLGLDDGAGVEELPADHESGLLMRFCPHDSSMLYPKVSLVLIFSGDYCAHLMCHMDQARSIIRWHLTLFCL